MSLSLPVPVAQRNEAAASQPPPLARSYPFPVAPSTHDEQQKAVAAKALKKYDFFLFYKGKV